MSKESFSKLFTKEYLLTHFRNVFLIVLASLLMICAFSPTKAQATQTYRFDDVPADAWYATDDIVGYVADKGLITGYGGSNNFGPEDNLTRGQVATILWRMAGSPKAEAAPFADVNYSQYYGNPINWARSVGIINGYSDGAFGPNDDVTREQFAKMAVSYSEKVADFTSGASSANLSNFSDISDISPWAEEYIHWAVANGLMSGTAIDGKTYLDPQGTTTRAQAAKMLAVLHRDVLSIDVPDDGSSNKPGNDSNDEESNNPGNAGNVSGGTGNDSSNAGDDNDSNNSGNKPDYSDWDAIEGEVIEMEYYYVKIPNTVNVEHGGRFGLVNGMDYLFGDDLYILQAGDYKEGYWGDGVYVYCEALGISSDSYGYRDQDDKEGFLLRKHLGSPSTNSDIDVVITHTGYYKADGILLYDIYDNPLRLADCMKWVKLK